MKQNKYFLNTLLVAVLFAALTIAMIVRVCAPAAIIPTLGIPNMVVLSVIALLLEHVFAKRNERCYVCVALLGAVSFGILPLMAGFACVHDFWKIGLVGGAVFTVTTFLFTSASERIATGPKATCAMVVTAIGICLAAQGFAGILI